MDHRKVWYDHVQPNRRGERERIDDSDIGCRARMYARIDKVQVNGQISISVDQMDCDCSRWTSGNVMDAFPRRAVEQYIEDIYNNAEGPIYWLSIDAPEKKAEYTSRDLALEAFEDGHAHSVSAARYDEDGPY